MLLEKTVAILDRDRRTQHQVLSCQDYLRYYGKNAIIGVFLKEKTYKHQKGKINLGLTNFEKTNKILYAVDSMYQLSVIYRN